MPGVVAEESGGFDDMNARLRSLNAIIHDLREEVATKTGQIANSRTVLQQIETEAANRLEAVFKERDRLHESPCNSSFDECICRRACMTL